LRFENIERVVLNISRAGIDLAELVLRAADNFSGQSKRMARELVVP
jgi:hypothetical protein